MSKFVDYYALLQVHPLADRAVIEKAYRVLIATHHPDAGGSTSNAQMLNVARDVLLDPSMRSSYDVEWRAQVGSAFLGGGGGSLDPQPSEQPRTVVVEHRVVVEEPRKSKPGVRYDDQGRRFEWKLASLKWVHTDSEGRFWDDKGRELEYDSSVDQYLPKEWANGWETAGDFAKAFTIGQASFWAKTIKNDFTKKRR